MTTFNLETTEIEKFETLAANWWDSTGECRTLHDINPVRLQFIMDRLPSSKLNILDIGCGGGILAESMAERGATVIGIDAAPALIEVAKLHALENQVNTVSYEVTTIEAFANQYVGKFDAITCMELLEHVPDPMSLIKTSVSLLKPNGHLFLSTLNRSLKAYLFAILGAEYIFKILPKHTHTYEKFIKPSELERWIRNAGLDLKELAGLQYNPLTHTAKLNSDVSINYMAYARPQGF